MRAWSIVALLVGWFVAAADAQPLPPPNNAEIDKLDAEQRANEKANDVPAQVATAKKLIAAQIKHSGEDSIYTTRRQLSLSSLLSQAQLWREWVALEKYLVAKAERMHGKSSKEVLEALDRLIGALTMARALDELEPVFQRSLTLSKKVHGENHHHAYELRRYGDYLRSRGEHVAGARVYEQALKILDATKQNPAGELSNLGMAYMQIDPLRAKHYFDRYIANQKQQMPDRHASTMWWVASIYRNAGRLDLAVPLEKEAIAVARADIARIEKTKGKEAKELDWLLFTLGGQLFESGDLAAAEPVITRMLEIQEKRKEPFINYGLLGQLRRKQGRTKEALAIFEKERTKMQALQKDGGIGMNSIVAGLYRELGNTKKAEQLLREEQAYYERYFGRRAMLTSRLYLNLYQVLVTAKQIAKAEAALADELAIGEKELAFVLASGIERDHLSYFLRQAHVLDWAIHFHASIAPKRASAARLALTTLLRRKGRMLDAAASSLGTLRARLPADDKKLFEELEETRARLAKVAVQGAQMNPNFIKEVAALEDQVQKLEVALAKKNKELAVVLRPVELSAVQKRIPKDARLVEIINYQPSDPTAPQFPTPTLPPRRYAAYVLAAKGDPVLVDLGEAAPIDALVAKLRTALADPDNDGATDLSKQLYSRAFAKLAKALGPATEILIAPDGALNVVPFAALHDGKQFLVGKYTFTYLTSGRDLLRVTATSTKRGGAVIFADPDFDGPKAKSGAGRRSRAMQGLSWPRLPGTAAEADALEKALRGVKVYRGKHANETTLKATRQPSILHLATHGFFLADGDASVENPLLRSGLVFSGANGFSSGADDGVLTALEAAGLDLRGTGLVVMSACETGVGKITNGEGVYGLRRALVIAGAESLVMSMWQVDDAATKDLMVGYYKKLAAGRGRSAALAEIQREMLAQKKYAHPFYWASFIASGDRAPLR